MKLTAVCDDVWELTGDQARTGCLPKSLKEKENGSIRSMQLVPFTTINYIQK